MSFSAPLFYSLRAGNSFGDYERFESDPVKFRFCLVYVQSLAEKNTDKARSSAVNGNIEIARTDAEIFERSRILIREQFRHFFCRLTEHSRLRIKMQFAVLADFVLANLDAARWHTSPLVKQGLASDRDLPGLQNHVFKRAYVYYVRIQVS